MANYAILECSGGTSHRKLLFTEMSTGTVAHLVIRHRRRGWGQFIQFD